jgi:hypothetical protein
MRGVKLASAALGLIIGVLAAGPANAWIRESPQVWAHLTDPVEGFAVGPSTLPGADAGSIFAASNGANSPTLFVVPPKGCLLPGCTTPSFPITPVCADDTPAGVFCVTNNLLGVAFSGTQLLVVDSGVRPNPNVVPPIISRPGQVLAVPSSGNTRAATAFITLPAAQQPTAMLNAITFDTGGRIYVSDSANGIIWRTASLGGVATPWIQHPLLSPSTGGQPLLTPNVGANGLAFSADGTRLFVANTAFRQIIQIPVTGTPPVAGTPTVFATGINGPDGIAIHPTTNNVWIAANMSDEIVVIGSMTGRALAKLGDFRGLVNAPNMTCVGAMPPATPACVADGLLFPSNLAFTNDGSHVYIANPAFAVQNSIMAPWAELVTTWTISRLSAAISPLPFP